MMYLYEFKKMLKKILASINKLYLLLFYGDNNRF